MESLVWGMLAPKEVRVYDYSANKLVFVGSVWIANVPGALAGVASGLAKARVNLVASSSSNVAQSGLAEWGFFAETERKDLTGDAIEQVIKSDPNVVSCEIKVGNDGFVVDSLHYPLRMNTGQQVMIVRREIFTQMFARMREVLGSGGDVVLQQLGIATGQSVAQDRLRTLGREVVLKHELQLADEMMAQGWERLQVISFSSNPTRAVFRLHDSFECAGVRAGEPNSQFVKGYVEGYVRALYAIRVRCVEVRCVSCNNPFCEFEITEMD